MAISVLDAIPQEVLEHIAFFSATETLLGPPSGLIPLLLVSRSTYSRLSRNHHLYSLIYAFKFDIGPVLRRIGPVSVGSPVLSEELPRRFRCLKLIRGRLHRFYKDEDEDRSHELIFLAYTLMLENEGNNEQQLREYAQIGPWLKDYWFHPLGASRAADHLRVHDWLPETPARSMAMWLFWFLMRPEDYTKNNVESWDALNILKIFALAAHKYELTNPPWHQFVPKSRIPRTASIDYFSQHSHLAPPPLATPAILSFLTLVNKLAEGVGYSTPIPPSFSPSHLRLRDKAEWECEWQRCVILGRGNFDNILTDAFKPGSIEGVWEGMFTYTEFTAYAALLAGGEPHIIQRSMVVRHRQTWKLREHHLLGSDTRSDSGIGLDNDHAEPLPGGDPLRSYFPTGTQLRETAEGVEVQVPNRREIIYYQRASSIRERLEGISSQDIIITGEGHSAWGQFNLVGRVRPCDGFVSLSKEYVDGDRGKWLYRGYLVGDVTANLAGRWRDTLTHTGSQGYEGCFAMSRRR